ncbi:MAG: hypothetical protein ACRDJU_13660 [Actinomycetota bacterium]
MSNRFPLSGDVSEVMTWWAKSLSQQTGFININNVDAGDPDTETRVIQEVASYGRQLGWIAEALVAALHRLDGASETPADRAAIDTFTRFVQRVEAVKSDSAAPSDYADLDGLPQDLQAIRQSDPAAYDRLAAGIRKAAAQAAG